MRSRQTPPPASVSDEAIERFLAGRCDTGEAEQVRGYLAAHPAVERYYQRLRAELAGEAAGVGRLEAERAYTGLLRQVESERRQQTQPPELHTPRPTGPWSRRHATAGPLLPRMARYAMAAVLVALIVVFATRRAGHTTAVPTTYATPNGQRANITLPDGSTVMLDVASRLDVPADFATGHRVIRLVGEALFSAAHHTGTPLTVIAGQTTTRVLGTAFVVRHYTTDTTTTIAVRDGKVAVGTIVLTAHQQASVSNGGQVRVRTADPAQFTFASGVLTLNGVPLRDAITELDRWYDADIRLADPTLGANVVQGAFAAGSLSELSSILGFTFHTRVVREGRTITLYPK